MRSFKLKFVTILAVMMCTICIGVTSYAHHGKMNQNWGHNDYNNECGFGTYHYHCDNYPAHLHNNGVCPYTSTVSNSSGANVSNNLTNNTANNCKNLNNGKNTNAGKNTNSTPAKKSIINATITEDTINSTSDNLQENNVRGNEAKSEKIITPVIVIA